MWDAQDLIGRNAQFAKCRGHVGVCLVMTAHCFQDPVSFTVMQISLSVPGSVFFCCMCGSAAAERLMKLLRPLTALPKGPKDSNLKRHLGRAF